MEKLFVITGPTASGKTHLGVLLAQALNGEVVSADSMQIYRGMDIGTAKPSCEEQAGVPHHMLDVIDPKESYSVSAYVEAADKCIQDILSRGKLPIVVGGTGLYIDALIRGGSFPPPEDSPLRERLTLEYEQDGGVSLWAKLQAVDPISAKILHPNDKRRVVRALEVFSLSGVPIGMHNKASKEQKPRYEALKVALNATDRADLYARIDQRVDIMMQEGLEDEFLALLAQGPGAVGTAMQAIGYKELLRAHQGEITQAQAIDQIKQESRRYAKRQLSWFRRDPNIHWLLWDKAPNYEILVEMTLKCWNNFRKCAMIGPEEI